MARFTKSKTSGQVRLKKWPPGRVSQLKVLLATLDKAANASLAGQITQTSKRVFSTFVPKIVLTTDNVSIEFREVRIAFAPPQGLRRFLFYEYQQSTDQNFATFEEFLSPEPQYTFSNLLDEGIYYFRVRVVTTNALHGPWSSTVVGITPAAKAIGLSNKKSVGRAIILNTFNTFATWRINQSVGGSIFYMVEYEVKAINNGASVSIADMEFRWIFDNDQQGQVFQVTAYTIDPAALAVRSQNIIVGNGAPAYSRIPSGEYYRCGTFIQRPHIISTGKHRVQLQARMAGLDFRPCVNEPTWTDDFGGPLDPDYTSGANISIKNFSSFEIRSGAI